jgi:hypothetical protein
MTRPAYHGRARLEVALFAGLALMLTALHALDVETRDDYAAMRAERHAEILEHRGKEPYVDRILAPELAELGRRLVTGGGASRDAAPERSYLAIQFVATFAGLILFRAVLAALYDPPWALAGTLLFAALHPASYRYFWFQPDSPIDLALWLGAAALAVRGKSGLWLLPLTAIGALNRETILFAPLIYGALAWERVPRRRLLRECAAALAAGGAVLVGVHLWIGPKERIVGLADLLRENLANPPGWLFAAVFFGVLWLLPLLRWRRASPAVRRLTLVLLPCLLLALVFGRIREVRLFLPLSLALIPHLLEALGALGRPAAAQAVGQGVDADEHHPGRKDQEAPVDHPAAEEEREREGVAGERHPARRDAGLPDERRRHQHEHRRHLDRVDVDDVRGQQAR